MRTTEALGTSSASVGKLDPEHLPIFWPGIVQMLEEHKPHWMNKITQAELLVLISTGKVELWAGLHKGRLDGIIVAHWETFQNVSNYKIDGVMGKSLRKYLTKGLDIVEKYVVSCGGSNLDIEADPAIQRIFQRWGFSPVAVTLRKPANKKWMN